MHSGSVRHPISHDCLFLHNGVSPGCSQMPSSEHKMLWRPHCLVPRQKNALGLCRWAPCAWYHPQRQGGCSRSSSHTWKSWGGTRVTWYVVYLHSVVLRSKRRTAPASGCCWGGSLSNRKLMGSPHRGACSPSTEPTPKSATPPHSNMPVLKCPDGLCLIT